MEIRTLTLNYSPRKLTSDSGIILQGKVFQKKREGISKCKTQVMLKYKKIAAEPEKYILQIHLSFITKKPI